MSKKKKKRKTRAQKINKAMKSHNSKNKVSVVKEKPVKLVNVYEEKKGLEVTTKENVILKKEYKKDSKQKKVKKSKPVKEKKIKKEKQKKQKPDRITRLNIKASLKEEKKQNKIFKKRNKPKMKLYSKILLGLTIFILICMIAVLSFGYYIYKSAPDFKIDALYNRESTVLYDINGDEYARLGSENRELITYNDLPQVLIDAIVATEDSRFYQHNGFDIVRFIKASIGQLKNEKDAGGASTITMQLSKNSFTSTEYTGISGIIRKFTDIYLSMYKIEKTYSKKEIMEFYVNAPYLGSGAYGVEMASQIYFGKSVKDLNLSESALIAGLFNAPSTYDPNKDEMAATKRRDTVLDLMVRHGYITEEQANDAKSITVKSMLTKNSKTRTDYQGFIDNLVEEIVSETGNDPYVVPMKIYTTLDPKIQRIVNTTTSTDGFYKDLNIQVGIAVTNSNDGSISALGNGRNRVGERQYNYATMISRHPGSAIKPFMVYGPIFETTKMTPNSYILDAPYKYSNGIQIFNADRKYLGNITLKTALYRSRNIPAVKLFQTLDKDFVSDYVHSFGIDYGSDLYESAALGGFNGVSPLVLSSAYGAYARGGIYIKPYSFTKIIYRNTNQEYNHEVVKTRVCSEQTAKYINEILVYAVSSRMYGILDVGTTMVAGKTGTSTIDPKIIDKYNLPNSVIMDSWANIYTSDYSISIWSGYDEISKNNYITSPQGVTQRTKLAKYLSRNILNTGAKFAN